MNINELLIVTLSGAKTDADAIMKIRAKLRCDQCAAYDSGAQQCDQGVTIENEVIAPDYFCRLWSSK